MTTSRTHSPSFRSPSKHEEDVIRYEVSKTHHRMTWLSQMRILRISHSSVENCRPADDGGLEATKTFPFSSLSVAVNGTTKLCLRVKDDHNYFYASPQALEIALEIQKRISASHAVSDLVSGSCEEDSKSLMRSFCRGDIQLPQFADSNARKRGQSRVQSTRFAVSPQKDPHGGGNEEADHKLISAAEDEVYLSTLNLHHRIRRAYREDYFPTVKLEVKRLVRAYQNEALELLLLGAVREDMDSIKGQLMTLIIECASSKSRRFEGLSAEMEEDGDFITRIADDILQYELLQPITARLWESLLLQPELIGLQRTYDVEVDRISLRAPAEFGVLPSMSVMQFDLVTKSMQTAGHVSLPTHLMDQLVNIAKSIVLTVEVHARLEQSRERRRRSPSQHGNSSSNGNVNADDQQQHHDNGDVPASSSQVTSLSADDVLPLYIYLLVRSKMQNVVFIREWITKLGDQSECSERTYYLTMFSSAVEYVINGAWTSLQESPTSKTAAVATPIHPPICSTSTPSQHQPDCEVAPPPSSSTSLSVDIELDDEKVADDLGHISSDSDIDV